VDTTAGERWMTYAEIADMRGCSRAAAERWTQRQKLRRQPGNDGKTRVLVTPNVTEQMHPRKDPRTDPADVTPALAAFEQALSTIREAHAAEVAALRGAHAGEASTLRDQLGLVRAALDQAQAEARTARHEAETLRQAEAARKARGVLARLSAALRGE